MIAIISLLAAILFPVFGRARENARRTSCLSNVKQLSLGLLLYTQDYDETFVPFAINFFNSSIAPPYEKPLGWADALYAYTKTIAVNQCPSEARPPASHPAAGLQGGMEGRGFMDYGYNGMLGNDRGYANYLSLIQLLESIDPDLKPTALKLSALSSPSLTVAIFDSVGTDAINGAGMGRGYGTGYIQCQNELARISEATTPPSEPSPISTARHLGGNIVGFCDGHAKWFPSSGQVFGETQSSSTKVWSVQSARIWDAKHGTKHGDPTFAINEEGTPGTS